jgi:GNAT superfamily N-acetyltransferase
MAAKVDVEPSTLTVRALCADTWPAYAELIERHNGVCGSCWCTWFGTSAAEGRGGYDNNRALKQRLVSECRAHAAVVFDGDEAVGWCQYGTPRELPHIFHRKEYDATATRPPDYRLTCIFVDKRYRRQGIAAVALRGALDLIALAGGGVVEGYPHDTQGQKLSSSHLYNGTRHLFEQAGFRFDRPKGPKNTVMVTTVPPS